MNTFSRLFRSAASDWFSRSRWIALGILTVALCAGPKPATAQTTLPLGEWAWMGGGDTYYQFGVYGTLGVPAAGNTPGNRAAAASWTDSNGNLWLFGGVAVYDFNFEWLNDLWEYNPSTKLWVWIGGSSTSCEDGRGDCSQPGNYGTLGVPAAGNTPGGCAAGGVNWIDKNGNFWLFGCIGTDLWEYNSSTKLWAWMSGSHTNYYQPGDYGTLGVPAVGNTPGARDGAVSWTDKNGNFWLFGGQGWDAIGNQGRLNDLWKYNPSTKLWAWMGGSDTVPATAGYGRPGVYGTLGVPAAANIPGGRDSAVAWTDKSGNFWLFGGETYAGGDSFSLFNDLWEYDSSTKLWAWMGGSDVVDQSGVYGTLGTPAAGNIPGARAGSVSWTGSDGNLWLFGGYYAFNDLWEYNPSTKLWAWMDGSDTVNQTGVYGTLGTPTAENIPGARDSTASWTDKSGNLWLFGGTNSYYAYGYLNDLWEYQPTTTPITTYSTTTAVTSSSNPTILGRAVTFTATVTPSSGTAVPAGTVQFSINGFTVGSPVTLDATGSTTYSTSNLPVGSSNRITAAYTPSSAAPFFPSVSAPLIQKVYSSPRQSGYVHFDNSVRTLGSGFNHPYGVAVDASGNVFVADTDNNAVKEIVAAGGYSTIKKLGSGFSDPTSVAVDASGNLFVADPSEDTIYELTSATSYATAINLERNFNWPYGVATDSNDSIYITDTGDSAVKSVAPCANCDGGYDYPTAVGSGFEYPWGVAVDRNDNIYVTDVGTNTVSEIVAASGSTTTKTLGAGFFLYPYGIAVDINDNIYVTDAGYNAVRELSAVDGYTTVTTPANEFNTPIGIAVDASGNLFVADTGNNAIKEVSQTGGDVGSVKIGTSSSSTISMNFFFDASTTLGSIAVTGDFNNAGTGTCKAGVTYAANATCSVNVTFKPTQSGVRSGGVELLDAKSNVLAIGTVRGTGVEIAESRPISIRAR